MHWSHSEASLLAAAGTMILVLVASTVVTNILRYGGHNSTRRSVPHTLQGCIFFAQAKPGRGGAYFKVSFKSYKMSLHMTLTLKKWENVARN